MLKRDPLNAEAAYALGRYGIMSGISTAEARIAADWLMTEGRYSYAFGFLSKYTEISGKTGCMTELYLAYAAKMSGDSYADRIASAEKALDASAPAFARTLRDREVLRALGDENSFVVPYRRGNLEYDAGNADVAEEQWRKATAAAPERYEAYRNLALCSFNKKHDPGSALGYMEKAFGLSSGDPRVLSELCGLYRAVGKCQVCSSVTHHEQHYLMGKTDFKVRHGICKNRKFKNQSCHRHFHCHLLCEINKAADNFYFEVASLRYAIKSTLSDFFLIPAKIIFVPGMYFFGFSKYSIRVSSPQVIPLFLLASV